MFITLLFKGGKIMHRLFPVMLASISIILLIGTAQDASAGWSWSHPLPQGNHLFGSRAFSADDIWLVGTQGTILYFDGTEWQAHCGNVTHQTLHAIWGCDPGSLYVVGENGTFLRWNGTKWTQEDSFTDVDLYGIWGTGPDDIYAVGGGGEIHHFDGSGWTLEFSMPAHDLKAISGLSAQCIYAAGNKNTVLRKNGTEWIICDTPGENWDSYDCVSVASADHVFIGGYGMLLHYDGGSEWVTDDSPASRIHSIRSFSENEAFAVSDSGEVYSWNGAAWSAVSTSTLEHMRTSCIISTSDILSGGCFGAMYRWNGGGWSAVSEPFGCVFYDVFAIDWNCVYAASSIGIMKFNGYGWECLDIPGTEDWPLHGVWGTDSSNVYVAGGRLDNGDFKGAILHWDGSEWNTTEYWTDAVLQDIWGTSNNEIAVSGINNGMSEVHVWDGTAWYPLPQNPGNAGMYDIWCSSLNNIFVAGGYSGGSPSNPYTVGYIYRWDGSEWSRYSRDDTTMRGIWGDAPDSVYVTGTEGDLFHWDGSVWKRQHTGIGSMSSPSIFGFKGDDLFIAGYRHDLSEGVIAHWDGSGWRKMHQPCKSGFYAIHGFKPQYLFAAGYGSNIVRWNGSDDRETGVGIAMPTLVYPGSDFYVTGYLDNAGDPLAGVAVYFVLDIFGDYWFWDDWTQYNPDDQTGIDFKMMDVPNGTTPVTVIPRVPWPDSQNGTWVRGLVFYGCMIDSETGDLIGEMAVKNWSYQL
jgi:hypothetical protein